MVFLFRIVKILDDFYEAPRDGSTAVLKRNTNESSREIKAEIYTLSWLWFERPVSCLTEQCFNLPNGNIEKFLGLLQTST
ncbi:hypothetical protein J2T60_001764 [Natronospira proteinivora]|uniref:Uncharacterized protein n=1 Tax=Natronospira proteinivora TaxID=1807133 RepID=A0ABT1G8Y8_9GAMM|nr:hypothetical protein [Natronospira proteinivora]